ncbi:hypothetical protein [Flavilitoribacter nigricans]|uniref:Uncharacterized protein n=1 Tax=Flavilitoribacter nigricans (strain ATCC 23147 / DSM 23189 / NBRC 102662 / NCIMB 1420 / SS-2) TaxID=1122177 RepID=A0A2D0N695_FLAN2|nr:hypothetical protein [Flavilitoribacter nigricans]PHN03900.1 hypothetical protein CRP01_23800 [Flavilitoribacter nigricans DSM 23189 = NBRC 102662]
MNPFLDTSLDPNFDLGKIRFHGRLAGDGWRHEHFTHFLTCTQILFFFTAIVLLFAPVAPYIFPAAHLDTWIFTPPYLCILLFLTCGFLFNRFRLVALLLALSLFSFMTVSYTLYAPTFSFYPFGLLGALTVLVMMAIVLHFLEKKLRKFLINELENNPIAPFTVLPGADLPGRSEVDGR